VIAVNPDAGNTIGWPSFADQVSRRASSIVITSNYGEAGALERYTSLRVYSGHNGYGQWEIPPGSMPALLVGIRPTFCATSRIVGKIRMPVDNDAKHLHTPRALGATMATDPPHRLAPRTFPPRIHLTAALICR
jgi:hypothetical protein